MIRVAIRVYGSGRLLCEDKADFADMEAAEYLLHAIVEKHLAMLADHPLHMIEIEFPDEPNPKERFLRFGTDTSRMVIPIEVKL